MAGKIFLFICLQTLLIKVISSQCINAPDFAEGLGPARFFYGPASGLSASTGSGFQVTSYSPIAPTGLSIISENIIEGPVFVGGLLPFLSAVSLGGSFPSAGLGTISYGCGDEAVGIVSEGPIATGAVGPYGPAYGPGMYGPPSLPYGPMGFGPGLGFGPGFPYGPGPFMPAYGPELAGFDGPAPGCGVVC